MLQNINLKIKIMKITQYQQAKNDLKTISQWAKNKFPDDKPAIRQTKCLSIGRT